MGTRNKVIVRGVVAGAAAGVLGLAMVGLGNAATDEDNNGGDTTEFVDTTSSNGDEQGGDQQGGDQQSGDDEQNGDDEQGDGNSCGEDENDGDLKGDGHSLEFGGKTNGDDGDDNGSKCDRKLVVTKTADLQWKRVTNWSVEKSASDSVINIAEGSTAGTMWTLDVDRDSVDNYYMVSGTISVTNPFKNDVKGVQIEESLADASIDCVVVDGGTSNEGDGHSWQTPLRHRGIGWFFLKLRQHRQGHGFGFGQWAHEDGDDDGAAGYTIPAGGTLSCGYSAPIEDNVGGTNTVSVSTSDTHISGEASDAWEALEAPNAGDLNPEITAVDERLDESYTAHSSRDKSFHEEFPCANATITNEVVILGDNPETEEIEADYVLDSASAQVTTKCVRRPEQEPKDEQASTTPPVVTAPAALTPPVAKSKKPGITVIKPAADPKPEPKPVVKPAPKPEPKVVVKPAPKPEPKPEVKPEPKPVVKDAVVACTAIAPSVRTAPSGRRSLVTFVVTQAGKPVAGARIRLTGPGILKMIRTGAAGRVTTAINPHEAGLLTVDLAGKRDCSVKRIGVIAPVEPPVTG